MPLKPLAFISYAHIDDEYHGGAITEFRRQLSLAVQVIAGQDFHIFQDRDSIEWGQSWGEVLDAALGEVRFLIPILTPSFFRSKECRKEIQAFLDREAGAGRNDLVLPIHYVTCSILEDNAKRRQDQLASALAKRQYRDWRSLRHKPFTAPEVRHALEEFALDIDRAMHRLDIERAMHRKDGKDVAPKAPPTPKPPKARRKPQTPTPPRPGEPDDLSVLSDGDFAPELVVLPRGEFMMGSTEAERRWAINQGAKPEWVEWEKPQHRVKIGYRFAVGRYPVAFEEWDRYAGDADWPRSRHMEPHNPYSHWGRGNRPVIDVSWEDIQGYLRWLNDKTGHRYRLPSEAEWEYACRAGTTTAYSTGGTLTRYDANFGKKVGKTVEVGSYTANKWRLHDMHGNVWEWVEDCWNDSYDAAERPDDGSAWTTGDCDRRMLRGGSWYDVPGAVYLRSAVRAGFNSDYRVSYFGFRVARMLAP